MTIGIFLEHYDPFISGVITSVKNLQTELEARGHTVYVVCPEVKGYRDKSARIIRIPSISTKESDNTTIGLPWPPTIKRLMRIKFDVIHSQDVLSTAAVGKIVAKRQNIPYVQTYHTMWHRFVEQYKLSAGFKATSIFGLATTYPFVMGMRATASLIKQYSDQDQYSYSNLWWSHMVNLGNYAAAVTVPSEHMMFKLTQANLKTPLHHLPNGITPSQAHQKILPHKKSQTVRIISVGRFSSEKRLDVLIKSLTRLKFAAELIMVGDGPDFNLLEKLAFQTGVSQKVRFMGHLSNASVRQLMNESDIFCLSSYRFDNQPMVILEALAAGLPIVYCDPDLTDGLQAQNSLLSGRTPEAFSMSLEKLSDDRLRKRMAAASRHLAADYDIRFITNRLLQIYRTAGALT